MRKGEKMMLAKWMLTVNRMETLEVNEKVER